MTIYANVYPTNMLPEKSQIEQMYQVAYGLDPTIFMVEDVERFGLNAEKLEKFGAVEMHQTLDRLRKHVHGLWARMSKAQKVMFLMSYVNTAIPYLQCILADLQEITGKEIPLHEQLTMAHSNLATSVALDVGHDIAKLTGLMKRMKG